MVATTATDAEDSGVEYYFDETSENPGGNDSDWQDSAEYVDTGLSPATESTYIVTARDKSAAHNATTASSPASATTDEENVVLPANGGVLESFTSEYGEYNGEYYLAADLTNGITDEDGWSSSNGSVPQEFVYSFLDGNNATLDEVVIHGGTAEGQYYSKNVEVWISTNGSGYTIAASGMLLDQDNYSTTFDLGDVEATEVKLKITSGYSNYLELAEFVVNGTVID